jgi:hypothetical protein
MFKVSGNSRYDPLAFGRFAIFGQVALQAILRPMATKAFEIDFFPGRPSPSPRGGAPSEAAWERIRPLFAPQKPSTGRPWHDHRDDPDRHRRRGRHQHIVARVAVGVWEMEDRVQALPVLV